MSTKVTASIIFGVFIIAVSGIIYYYRSSLFETATDPAPQEVVETPTEAKPTPTGTARVDRIQIIEDALSELKKNQDSQEDLIVDLSEKVTNLSTASAGLGNNGIFDIKHTQGGAFNTSSTAYTPMSMFVNATCSGSCILWINFYTTSKNDAAGNLNTYGVFVNGQDKGIYSQSTIPSSNGAVPISLNASIPATSGTHTVEIKTKTSGGTLRSEVSFLQVLAIEQ